MGEMSELNQGPTCAGCGLREWPLEHWHWIPCPGHPGEDCGREYPLMYCPICTGERCACGGVPA